MDTALVTVVDTDSFQVPNHGSNDVFHCPVAKPEFTPPEMQGFSLRQFERTPVHDRFGLAVLIFQLLMEGTHPFAGVYTGEDDPPPYETRIQAGHYPHGSGRAPYGPALMSPPIELLPSVLRTMFQQCFEEGHRNPQARPHASAWVKALSEAEQDLIACSINDQHVYGNHLNVCPWCRRTELLDGRDPFPSKLSVVSGRHRSPIPIKAQSALPAASAQSFRADSGAVAPPRETGWPENNAAAPESESFASIYRDFKEVGRRFLSHVRSKVKPPSIAQPSKPPAYRITYANGAKSPARSRLILLTLRYHRQVFLVVLVVIAAVIIIQLTKHVKPQSAAPTQSVSQR
jgi:hypothetical protein